MLEHQIIVTPYFKRARKTNRMLVDCELSSHPDNYRFKTSATAFPVVEMSVVWFFCLAGKADVMKVLKNKRRIELTWLRVASWKTYTGPKKEIFPTGSTTMGTTENISPLARLSLLLAVMERWNRVLASLGAAVLTNVPAH